MIKLEFMAELLYWIALDFKGDLNKVTGECIILKKNTFQAAYHIQKGKKKKKATLL